MSLLDNAKAYIRPTRTKTEFTDEDLELIEAWLNNEITHSQVLKAKKLKAGTAIYTYLAIGSKIVYQKNKK